MTHAGRAKAHHAVVVASALLAGAALQAARAEDQPGSPNPLQGLDKGALRGFRDRPLFSPTRTEATTAPAATTAPSNTPAPPPPAEAPPPSFRLVGIVSGATTLAMVRLDNASAATLLATGDKLGDWTITVLPAGVRLDAGSRSIAVDLFAPKTAAPSQGLDGPVVEPPSPPTMPP